MLKMLQTCLIGGRRKEGSKHEVPMPKIIETQVEKNDHGIKDLIDVLREGNSCYDRTIVVAKDK